MKPVKLSERCTLYPGSEGEWPYKILYGDHLGIVLTTNELNALAAHAPVVKAQTAALRDALDWIEDECHPDRGGTEFHGKRSRVIEGAHAALQGVEDSKHENNT